MRNLDKISEKQLQKATRGVNIFNKLMVLLISTLIVFGWSCFAANVFANTQADDSINESKSNSVKIKSNDNSGKKSFWDKIKEFLWSVWGDGDVPNLDKEVRKKIFEKLRQIEENETKVKHEYNDRFEIKTATDIADYYEKNINEIFCLIKDLDDKTKIDSSLSKALIKQVNRAVEEIENDAGVLKNDSVNELINELKQLTGYAKNIGDFKCIFKNALDAVQEIKNIEKTAGYSALLYKPNKNTINVIKESCEYSKDAYIKISDGGETIYGSDMECSGRISYDEESRSIFVSFCGTKNFEDVKSDIYAIKKKCDFLNGKTVHSGFLSVYIQLSTQVKSEINKIFEKHKDAKIVFTGHSLGGAIATLAAMDAVNSEEYGDKQIKLITFCSPKVLSAEAYEYCMGNENLKKLYEHTIRVWRKGDIVTSLPPESYGMKFKHFGQSFCIDKYPDNYDLMKESIKSFFSYIKSWFSYLEWAEWIRGYYKFHSLSQIQNDICKVFENNKKYINKIRFFKLKFY